VFWFLCDLFTKTSIAEAPAPSLDLFRPCEREAPSHGVGLVVPIPLFCLCQVGVGGQPLQRGFPISPFLPPLLHPPKAP